jgi:hypothetical protein
VVVTCSTRGYERLDDKSIHFAIPCIENMDLLLDEAPKQADDCPYCGVGNIGIFNGLR